MTTAPGSARPFRVVHGDTAGALPGAVVAIGNFDGLHRGHQAVVEAALARARALGRPAAALTFEPHPRSYFRPDEPLFRLSDPAMKLRLLAGTGLDAAIVLPFDAALADLSAEEFVRRVLVERLAIAGAAIGYDFHFGHARSGSPAFLTGEGARRGFPVEVVPPLARGTQRVSSSAVRAALAHGEIRAAQDLLGHPWFVGGTVRHGDKRGRDLGYPTANLRLDPSGELMHGIYAVRVSIDGETHDGVASFGRRPTFDNGAPLLEVFIFDFAGDLYGRAIDVALIDFIRPELRFDGAAALVRQMDDDARAAREILAAATPTRFPPRLP
jgi:riboflavin kinase/FMN adenylyltransferase